MKALAAKVGGRVGSFKIKGEKQQSEFWCYVCGGWFDVYKDKSFIASWPFNIQSEI